ncbi:hypothetical protein [Nonomuraea rhodomycinica]|uniref:Methyl-accepting transducer domain-containing protein n=1 Tax=Nonomuraea rhodomycinica TaxID=1712872 RepID=A0A7Y6IN59_9ACTN|nr:hypothetical protein [Nonomuraea rhodomycinica]NUW41247.1 hypothetical protein [Nonomuraea rhodomycinica]
MQLVPLAGVGPAAAQAAEYDLAHAASVRAAQCLLTTVQRKGGQAMKAVARAGLGGSDDVLLRNADDEHWSDPPTPLHTAFDQDDERIEAKLDELNDRPDVWEQSLLLPPPKGYTDAAFQTIKEADNPFHKVGLSSWLFDQSWQSEDDFYADQTPQAAKESVDAAKRIAAERYPEDGDDDEAWDAWEDMTFMHPMYADDARAFLERGGFADSAPDPDSMEFRVDVENLKARYASCTTANPPDPHHVLGAEFAAASQEWQQEVDGQRAQRDTILKEEAEAAADLQVASQALGEALGQSIIASRLTEWQAYWLKQSPDDLSYPSAAQFAKVKTDIVNTQAMALGRVYTAGRAAQSAQRHAAAAVTAQQAAHAIADAAGLPRGRGLLYGQQAVQVTRASAAAALAVAKATETAANATRASAADSKTLMALAETQAHASRAEFRRMAAEEAAAQAKAAAEGAAAQAALAAENAAKAKSAQARAEAAEQTAKAAAADARAKRQIAEAERDNARAQKEIAAREQANAAAAESTAQSQRQVAASRLGDARAAGATAASKMDDAVEAERRATTARSDALAAERRRDILAAQAAAAEAQAAADEGTDDAAASRAAATQARSAATAATTAATNARAAADQATASAVAAREAATRAEASAARARSASDAAQRDVAITSAAVMKAHAAAADAIKASWDASINVRDAKAYADTAKANAVKARADAVVARKEADAAHVSAVKTAGFAYATAQAALAARDSAAQVIKPANDAIELGSPYKETDASAGLAVLTAQASKTLAQQQAAVAQAKATQAQKAATEAATLAEQASADAKAAATAASQAAGSAARAAASLAQAQASAAEAKTAAKAAVEAESNTVEYDRQATADAAAAASAADAADEYAGEARDSADEAERDAASARAAAGAAENDAATARDVATQAEADATAAETAAANARQAAKDAQDAATRTEEAKEAGDLADQVAANANVLTWFEFNDKGYIEPLSDCVGTGGCDIRLHVHLEGTVYYMLLSGCQVSSDGSCTGSYFPLGDEPFTRDYETTRHFTQQELMAGALRNLVKIITHDFTECAKAKVGNCAMAATFFIPPEKIAEVARKIIALQTAIRSRIGFDAALEALRASVAGGEVAPKALTTAVATLEGFTGMTATGTKSEQFAKLAHIADLGFDSVRGFRADEAASAMLFEAQSSVRLSRYKPPAPEPGQPTPPSPDWVGSDGLRYDAMGRNLTPAIFAEHWAGNGGNLKATIAKHVAKADVTIFDVSKLGASELATLRAYYQEMGWSSKVSFVGVH